ncbi:hypothetical protein U1Q18_001600 [Sarracenia purpurea var. burkii]
MNQYSQNQPQVAYPPPSTGYSAAVAEGLYVVPPPVGYPMKGGEPQPKNFPPPGKTRAREDGFWKGCAAALCCCCVLDTCC